MADDDKTFAMLCHLLAIFTTFLGPLIIWLVKRGESSMVDQHGKAVLNFVFTVMIAYVALFILATVLAIILPLLGALVFLVVGVMGIAVLVLLIMGTLKANSGELYEYPLAIAFLK